MFCRSCGQRMGGQEVCPSCGRPQKFESILEEAAAVAATVGPLPARPAANGISGSATTISSETSVETSGPRASTTYTPQAHIGDRRIVGLLVVAILILAGVGVAGGIYAKSVIDQRDAASAMLQAQVGDLTRANLGFQDEVNNLTAERDQLAGQRDELTAQRDQATADLSTRTNERDALNDQLTTTQQRASDAETTLAQVRTQLDQTRQEVTNQQQRATSANARSTAIAAVLQIDDQIQANFIALLTEVGNMQQASDRRDYYGVSSAYSRAQVIANRLVSLFDQRKAALARV